MKSLTFFYFCSLLICATLHAEVNFDGTLGPRIALEGPDYAIGAELGQQVGGNLFHSFDEFNLNMNESATFSGPDSINNIMSRVTGGNPSHIDGALRSTIPNADFYFINPAGLMFGPNATLDVPGAFHASTADTLHLQDGGQFNARNPSESSLTIAPVSAFGFLTESKAPLSINGTNAKVSTGNDFSLVAGDIQINQAKLTANAGRFNLASIAQAGNVTLQPDNITLPSKLGNITIHDSRIITSFTRGGLTGGDIYIRADKFELNNSRLESNTLIGKGKKIDIQAKEVAISHGGQLTTTTWGSGKGGHIKIQAAHTINLSGVGNQGQGSTIVANVGNPQISATKTAKGNGGSIDIDTDKLQLSDGALIGTTTYGYGNGGNLNIKVTDKINFSGEDHRGITSGILSATTGAGNAGTVEIEAKQLHLAAGAKISTESIGTGQGGNIKIQAGDLVRLSGISKAGQGSFIVANASGTIENAGDGGMIELNAKHLQLAEGAQIGTATFGAGQGGKINLNVTSDVFFEGIDKIGFHSGIFTMSQSKTNSAGNAGSIILKAGNLYLANAAKINAGTAGFGKGGNVNIDAQNVNMINEGTISAFSDGQGNAGQMVLTIGNQLKMKNSTIEASAKSADGGNIAINSPSYFYLIDSQITASVNEEFGSGGNLFLNPRFMVLDGSQIFAKAKKGLGGNIDITTKGIYNFTGEPLSTIINASSEFGVDGVVTISTPDEEADEGLFILPSTFFDASDLFYLPCKKISSFEKENQFFVKNFAGSSPSPYDWKSIPLLPFRSEK
ncbi:filamentous hemagglutinin N-terminal domain-containing protein [Candidatus Parabeggiatoa sp. HSG14]|uniref:two-partner secretion domain-containing protein n=1 Tax=Candidatus Parabeggiatoa sp. HSG14 TaxID=3055593 RepID=UPI0025A759BB|nr:filamentous hemagglutinin N-terminal domain-containing protein [Thiotrichales bacterium HSG14]